MITSLEDRQRQLLLDGYIFRPSSPYGSHTRLNKANKIMRELMRELCGKY